MSTIVDSLLILIAQFLVFSGIVDNLLRGMVIAARVAADMTRSSITPVSKESLSLPEHNDLVSRLCSAITSYFQTNTVEVREIELSPEVLNRSASEVLMGLPEERASVLQPDYLDDESEDEVTQAK